MASVYERFMDQDNVKPIGVLPMSNWGGLEILEINGCDQLVACFNWGSGRQMIKWHNIHLSQSGRAYFRKQGVRYYLDEIQRV